MTYAALAPLIRNLLLILGSSLVTRGIIDQGSLAALVDNAMTALGALVVIVMLLIEAWKRRPAGVLDEAAKLPGVDKIVATPELARKTVSAKVVGPPTR